MFTSVLREHSTGGFDPLTPKGLQPWARPWRGSLDPRWKLVTGYFSRPDAYLQVDVAIAEDGVRALWKTGMDGRQAAALARSWIAALRAKDVSALTRLSTFPFELRDRGRHASCGRRTAGKPDELPGTLSCLLNSEVLHRALLESLESPAIVARADDEPPEWAAAWLNTRLGPPSTRVGMLVATSAGDEFELVMLLSDAGVHAVYEWGGFEATE